MPPGYGRPSARLAGGQGIHSEVCRPAEWGDARRLAASVQQRLHLSGSQNRHCVVPCALPRFSRLNNKLRAIFVPRRICLGCIRIPTQSGSSSLWRLRGLSKVSRRFKGCSVPENSFETHPRSAFGSASLGAPYAVAYQPRVWWFVLTASLFRRPSYSELFNRKYRRPGLRAVGNKPDGEAPVSLSCFRDPGSAGKFDCTGNTLIRCSACCRS